MNKKDKPLDDGQEGKGLRWVSVKERLPKLGSHNLCVKDSTGGERSNEIAGYSEGGKWFEYTPLGKMELNNVTHWLDEAALPVADGEVEKVFTADELEKAFYRSSNEGYQDAKINGKKFPNFHALVNYEQSKDWFKWLATKNIPK